MYQTFIFLVPKFFPVSFKTTEFVVNVPHRVCFVYKEITNIKLEESFTSLCKIKNSCNDLIEKI